MRRVRRCMSAEVAIRIVSELFRHPETPVNLARRAASSASSAWRFASPRSTSLVANIVAVPHSRRLDFPAGRCSGLTRGAACLPSENGYVIGRNEPLALLG